MDESAISAATEPPRWGRLVKRAEFQRVSRGRRTQVDGFVLQANRREETNLAVGPRVGLTVTKKVGNSVQRNRIRRRLREALRRVSALEALPDHDYVLMAREAALTRNFEALVGDVGRAFALMRRVKPRSNAPGPHRDGRS